jgi:hypothetical protein
MADLADIHLRGTRAAQPAATTVAAGTIYCVTDESGILERASGTGGGFGVTWQSYSPTASGSGTVTATGTLTAGKSIVGNGGTDITVSALTAQLVGSTAGTPAAASMTTNRLLGRTTAASGAVEEITPGSSLKFSAGALDGRVVQVVNTETGAVSTGSTSIPMDDTIPQITEGFEVMTLAITPTSATNKLLIEVITVQGNSLGSRFEIAALFQDATANALAAVVEYQGAAGALNTLAIRHYMTAGTTSSTTFRVRIGVDSTGTVSFNGIAGVRQFGGVMASSITITEITV